MSNITDLGSQITRKLNKGHTLFELKYLLEYYDGYDYLKFLNFSEETYTRTKMFSNDQIEIILICWDAYQTSGIHDHPNNGCLMKVLKGKLKEDVYVNEDNNYKFTYTNILTENDVGYRQADTYIHNIINGDIPSISLHIYSPPNYSPNYY